jgi:predicted MFS family arabinose efflux permease
VQTNGLKQRIDVNRPSAIAAAVILSAVSAFIYNAMPTFLGSIADSLELNEQQIGFIASAFLFGVVLVATSGVFWLRRASWKKSVVVAFGLVITAYLTCLLAHSYTMFVALMFIAGVGSGLIYAIALTSIGDTIETERNIGYAVCGNVVLGAVGLFAFPVVNRLWGFPGIIGALIAVTSLVAVCLPWFPDRGVKQAGDVKGRAKGPVYPVFVGLGALLLLFTGLSGAWAFIERVAVQAGIEPTTAGTILGILMTFAAGGALLAAYIGNRFGNVKPIWAGTIAILAALAMLTDIEGLVLYGLAALLFQGGWNFALPYQLGGIAQADYTGRFIPLVATGQGLGAVLGPSMAGSMILVKGYGFAFLMCGIAVIASLAAFTWLVIFNRGNEAS